MIVVYGLDALQAREQVYDLLAAAVQGHWGVHPMPLLARTKRGKPFFPECPELAFNLSHSGTVALCALSARPVGVDVQVVRQWRDSLPRRVCSPAEQAWLAGQDDFWRSFTLLWALKESRVKQSGQGITGSIAKIQVPLPQPGQSLLQQDGLWWRCYQGQGFLGAVCAEEVPPAQIDWISPAMLG